MKSFLSLLSERREMRDLIKPSGFGLESNPGLLAPELYLVDFVLYKSQICRLYKSQICRFTQFRKDLTS